MSTVVPIPARLSFLAEPAGRAGDWWEPVPQITAATAVGLCAEGSRRRLSVDLLTALLVERALIDHDVVDCAIEPLWAAAALAEASDLPAASGPGRLNSPYIRTLRTGDLAFEPESKARLTRRDLILPLRLHGAAVRLPLADLLRAERIDEAIRWETAAATTDQFMREWALRALLAAV